jgi:hypothetical protein
VKSIRASGACDATSLRGKVQDAVQQARHGRGSLQWPRCQVEDELHDGAFFSTTTAQQSTDEADIRQRIEKWAEAARAASKPNFPGPLR